MYDHPTYDHPMRRDRRSQWNSSRNNHRRGRNRPPRAPEPSRQV
jgi:hypothetical protein